MSDHKEGKLIKETEWARWYKWGDWIGPESKFLADGLKVSAESIRARWPTFSLDEKLDFAMAFSRARPVTVEDERILDYLMEAGDFPVWMMIAGCLQYHHDKDRVLAFLLERLTAGEEPKGNFFKALGSMNDKRALPALRAAYDGYRKRLSASPGEPTLSDYDHVDYLTCCAALWKISGSTEYKRAIEDALNSEDQDVRNTAELLLRGL